MLFNSFEFIIFFILVFIIYWQLLREKLILQNIFLLTVSYIFYGWWSKTFLLLLFSITFLDFIYGFQVASTNLTKSKIFFWLSIINNLGILVVFKYYNFFANELQFFFSKVGLIIHPTLINIALPIGISFYTFHGMSYIIDIYNRKQKPISNFIDYSLFVSFFPLLIAGPIERAGHLLPQIQKKRYFNYIQIIEGCRLLLWGVFKKVVIADGLAVISDETFNNYSNHNGFSLIYGAIAFSFQIYADFSGYSDMAKGLAKMLGIEILTNFNFPYFSKNISEFWKKWHISLTSWFRDYLFIPMGGSQRSKIITIRNIFIVFMISALWHGASLNFLIWGLIHASCYLPLYLLKNSRYEKPNNSVISKIIDFFKILTTFSFVTFAWIFFRSEGVFNAFNYINRIFFKFTDGVSMSKRELLSIGYIFFLLIIDLLLSKNNNSLNLQIKSRFLRWLFYSFLIFLIGIYMQTNTTNFIYFQF